MERLYTVKDMRKQYPIGKNFQYYESRIRHQVKVLNIYRKKDMIYFKLEALTECKPYTKVGEVFKVAFNQTCGMGGHCPWHLGELPSQLLTEE